MSRHRELKAERRKLTIEISDLQQSIDRVNESNRLHKSTLDSLEGELEGSIDKAKKAALAEEINKHTYKHTEILGKLNNKREEILNNRNKKLSSITYEKFSKKTKDKLSIEDSLERSEKIKNELDEKMGKRLSSELIRIIPSNKGFNSLNEIQEAFDELELVSSKLASNKDFLGRIEKLVFNYDTTEMDKNSSVVFIVAVLFVFILLMFMMPLLVLVLAGLFIINIHKSMAYYRAMSVVKVLVSNVTKINNSIEEGIKNRVKSKTVEVENKFKSMLDKVDKKIATVEDLISDTTAEVEADFNFNTSGIMESFRSRKDSIVEQIARNDSQIESYNSQIESLSNRIREIDEEIREEGNNIFAKYYPEDLSYEERSFFYLDDILLDIQENEPILFELPRGSSIFFYKDEESIFKFMKLYLASLISRMQLTSLYVKNFDIKYAGTQLLEYSVLSTVEQFIDKDAIKNCIEGLNKEMMKRIKILGNKSIDEYNKFMIEDDSSPMAYHVIMDLFNKPSDSDSLQRQLLVNGFKYGLIYHLFLDVKEVEGDKKCLEYIKTNYSEYYYVSDAGVSKKSSKFLSTLAEKK